METWNRAVFLALNAPEHASETTVKLATALAQDAIFLIPVLLATLWLWGRARDRAGLLMTFVGAEIALGFNQIAALLWYHPRPLPCRSAERWWSMRPTARSQAIK